MHKTELKRLMAYLGLSRAYLFFGVITALVSVALGQLSPLLIGQSLDALSRDNGRFIRLLTTLAYLFALNSAFAWVSNHCFNAVGYRAVEALRNACYEKFQTLPLSQIDSRPHGDLVSRFAQDAETLGEGIVQALPKLFTGIFTIVLVLAYMLSLNFGVALVIILMTPLSVLVARGITLKSKKLFREQADALGTLNAFLNERISNQTLISIFNAEEENRKSFQTANESYGKKAYIAQLYGSLVNPVARFVNHCVYIAAGVAGGIVCMHGGLSVGGVSAFLAYTNQYTKPFNEISAVITQIQSASAALKRIFAFLDLRDEAPDQPEACSLSTCLGQISFQDVYFSYFKGKEIIKGLSLKVEPGQKIAVVGPTGAGKTTFVNLLMRFYEIDSGFILLDGNDISFLNRSSLRNMFAMVLQDSWLFTGTIYDNIAFGKTGATEEEVILAAKEACAWPFISRLPMGFYTVVDEKSSLSQGEKQLISIARVLLANPPLLILDEATSSIDTRTEQSINLAFDRMMEGRSSIVIAHRLSTIRTADLILYLNDGKVAESGTHAQLLKQNGLYAAMYFSQFDREQADE